MIKKKVLKTIIDELVELNNKHVAFVKHSKALFVDFNGESKHHLDFEKSLIKIACSMFDDDDRSDVKDWIEWFLERQTNPSIYDEDDLNVLIDMKPFKLDTSEALADFLITTFYE